MIKTIKNKDPFTAESPMRLLKLLCAPVLLWCVCNGGDQIAGTSEVGNPQRVVGAVVNASGDGVKGVPLALLRPEYNVVTDNRLHLALAKQLLSKPASDADDGVFLADTTDSSGAFAFEIDSGGIYTLVSYGDQHRNMLYKPFELEDSLIDLGALTFTQPGAARILIDSVNFKPGFLIVLGAMTAAWFAEPGEILFEAPAGALAIRSVDSSGAVITTQPAFDSTVIYSDSTINLTGIVHTISRPSMLYNDSAFQPFTDTLQWVINTPLQLAISGARSNEGHTLEYQIWREPFSAMLSPWNSDSVFSRSWDSTGTYRIAGRARSSVDTNVISPWSDSVWVNIP